MDHSAKFFRVQVIYPDIHGNDGLVVYHRIKSRNIYGASNKAFHRAAKERGIWGKHIRKISLVAEAVGDAED